MKKNPAKTPSDEETPLDQRKVTKIQAKRIGALANFEAADLEHLTIAQVSDRLKWQIDPALFFFRRICGKVVKKDSVTGVEYPVPFATVYVEDTDCNLISYFPPLWPWGWFFPFFCHREVIATTTTDKCGNFCVWVPRFDIDWVLRWRRERVCFPTIFRRPSIGDLLSKVKQPVVGPWPPVPGPDPGPIDILMSLPPSTIEAIAGPAGAKLAQRFGRLQASQKFGAPNLTEGLLNARAFETELPPPLPEEFHRALAQHGGVVAAKGASATAGIRSAIAIKLGLDPAAKEIADFDPSRFIGPFFRCYDIIVPEWQFIFDVPDITFRVTQDTNGDGVEENIYSEGIFDVRWDAGDLSPVTLVASSIAKESHLCDAPPVPCGNTPAILFAGLMPLDNAAYFDGIIPLATAAPFNSTKGYALRPNRPSNNGATPSPTDMTRPVARTPFCLALVLSGCVDVQGANYYRFRQSTDRGVTFSAITGLSWNNFPRVPGSPIPIAADTNGWYEVNPTDTNGNVVPRNNLEFPNFILDWPTPLLGQCVLQIEIGDAGKNVIGSSDYVAIQVDNTSPSAPFTTLAWKFVNEDDSALRSLLGIPCPIIKRGSTPQSIEIVFEVNVSAHHLRDASIKTYGCGGGSFVTVLSDPLNEPSHWHTDVFDNSELLHQRYSLASSAMAGCYSFQCTAYSRAMNPDGRDSGNLLPTDWYEDTWVIGTFPSVAVAVVNQD